MQYCAKENEVIMGVDKESFMSLDRKSCKRDGNMFDITIMLGCANYSSYNYNFHLLNRGARFVLKINTKY